MLGLTVSHSSGASEHVTGLTKVPLKATYGEETVYTLHYRNENMNDEVLGKTFEEYKVKMQEKMRNVKTDADLLQYLYISVSVNSPFLLENSIELIDLPGQHTKLDRELSFPFLSGQSNFSKHRVDLILALNTSRSPDGGFIDRLKKCEIFLGNALDKLPRIVEFFNERTLVDNGPPIFNMPFEDVVEFYSSPHKIQFFAQLVENNQQAPTTSSQRSVLQYVGCRFRVAQFISQRLEDTKMHLSEVIMETHIMNNYKIAAELFERWSAC